ncbi:uncharacterized protein PAC_05143 [Phialocephala subalpina]|uniref:Uncharacterized protein n=1 Tax=Phialocephala subalpina TaxID=576137 RepID=A0A1L7WR65_9HELO|nr:uncharacterized protein PAC_05143 [Phialocephala subalpina]
MDRGQATGGIRKRKAETQDNERLSKRLALLNLERNGEKLYVPVEEPQAQLSTPTFSKPKSPARAHTQPDDDAMQLDNTKHKVYIYDLDAELSDSESSDDGKLIFLPDIEKHLRESRIPPSILANSEGELAGCNELVLYNVPSSLTVPEEQDSVRKAIIETRARARAKHEQEKKRNEETRQAQTDLATNGTTDAQDWYNNMLNGHKSTSGNGILSTSFGKTNGNIPITSTSDEAMVEDDPDAMDLG